MAPSPSADATYLVLPDRASPAAKTPSKLVSMVGLVEMAPHWSRSTESLTKAVLGSRPMKTKTALGVIYAVSPVAVSLITTELSFPSPLNSTTVVFRRTSICGWLAAFS